MNENSRHSGRNLTLAFAAIAIAGVAAWLPAQSPKEKTCCIAGDYRGTNIATQLPRCPVPESETFTMTISQAGGCGASVWGTITGGQGDVNNFTGTLSPGAKKCCVLTASFTDPGHPGHVVNFTGSFCKRGKKWRATGTFTETNSGDPCKTGGTWEVTQN